MPMTSANATTLKVKSAISDMRDEDGPHGSFEVASRTYTSPAEQQLCPFVVIFTLHAHVLVFHPVSQNSETPRVTVTKSFGLIAQYQC